MKDVLATIMVGDGDSLPVSKLPVDGTFPSATSRWGRKRRPQCSDLGRSRVHPCGTCSFVCPHACIRANEI